MTDQTEHSPTADDQPQPTGCLFAFKLKTSEEHEPPQRAMLHLREGNRVYVRAVDRCDPQPPPVRMAPGEEGRVLENDHAKCYVRRIAPANDPLDDGIPLFLGTAKEGNDTFLLSQRVVSTREEPGKIFGRTLRRNEVDDGRRIHRRPDVELVLDDIRLEAFLGWPNMLKHVVALGTDDNTATSWRELADQLRAAIFGVSHLPVRSACVTRDH